jgi:peptide/nickel transport system ATP-binding protein
LPARHLPPRKIGAICETELPPVKELTSGHNIMCHLPDDVLNSMEPVIAFKAKERAVG